MTDAGMTGHKTGSSDGKGRYAGPDWLPYADIIDKPHHVSKKHPPMSMEERAAQFSPFAALTGYEAAVKETARLTDDREELDEDEKAIINAVLQKLEHRLGEQPEVTVTYFVPDERKAGGLRKTITKRLKKIDSDRQVLVLTGGMELAMENLLNIDEVCHEG